MIAQGNSGANGWEDGDFNVAQFNVQAKGLLASDQEAVMWAVNATTNVKTFTLLTSTS